MISMIQEFRRSTLSMFPDETSTPLSLIIPVKAAKARMNPKHHQISSTNKKSKVLKDK